MSKLIQRIGHQKISRRDFLKGAAAATGAITVLNLTGCQTSNLETVKESSESQNGVEQTSELGTEHAAPTDIETGGEWKTAACWHNCGGRCVNKVYMKDGIVIRQKSDDTHADSAAYPQQRSCLRGHSQQQQCFGADRLRYPMKRKNWSLEKPNGELRGKDEWVRISWDEALDLIAEGIKTTIEKYGNRAVLYPNWTFVAGEVSKVLANLGGYVMVSDSASFGSFGYDIVTSIGLPAYGVGYGVDRLELMKCDTIVLYGCNPAWAAAGNPAYNLSQGKKKEMEYIFVGPEYNVTASMLEAKWIRVRPGTDTAFLLAVAYEMLKLDASEGNVIDWDFMNRNTVGFDSDHMPEGALLNENLKDYLLGTYDGIEKTAEWASEICGTPAEDIRWYAKKMGKENKVAILHSFAAARCNNAEDFPQIFYTIGAMGGHMGKSGHACGSCYHFECGNAGANIVNVGAAGLPFFFNPIDDCLRGPELWKGVVEGKYNYTGDYLMGIGSDKPKEERDLDIHLIYHESAAYLQSQLAIPLGIEAHRKVDMVVTQNSVLNTPAKYSDIVLPVTTLWERIDNSTYLATHNREFVTIPSKITEPLYEAKNDQWIAAELAKRLGIDPATLYPFDEKQQWFNILATSTFMEPDGSVGPLITITEEDLAEWGVIGTVQTGKIGLKEILEQGTYQAERSEGDGYSYIGWKAFRDNPEENPLPTPTGKFQIYSDRKAEIVNSTERNDFELKPYPTYHAPLRGYEQSFSDWKTKTKGKYPYQITNPHYLRRAHTTLDNLPWLRESMPNPVWINAEDAESKGVKEGDTVLIFNEFGKVLRHAALTERLMPGVIALPHGAWVQMDEEKGIDLAGADNVLLGPVCGGVGTSGYNTNLCDFEKYDGEELAEDWTWPQRIIEF